MRWPAGRHCDGTADGSGKVGAEVAAIDRYHGSGDHAGSVRGQEEGRADDVLGTDQAAKFNDTFATSCRNVSAYDAGCGSYTLEDAGGPRIATHTTVQGLLVEIPVPGQPVAPWLGAGDPANQTVIYTTWGSGCWIFESEDAPAGLSTGLLTWGPYGTLSGPKSNVCPFE